MSTPLQNRYEFVLLYDVENGNPNGDPDAGNMPRIDPETGYGIVTDVCLKRKIRNYVDLIKGDAEGWKIYVKEGIPLNTQHKIAYTRGNIPTPKNDNERKAIRNDAEKIGRLRRFMCQNFYDIRAFGAVMNTDIPAGIVRGPIQINFSRSIDPIYQQEVTITRVTVTEEGQDKVTEMGRKHIVPYGLYRVEGYVSAKLANDATKGTGFSAEDLELLWEALANMFEHDHSAGRGKMVARKLVVFKHESDLGNAPAHKLFELVEVHKNPQVLTARSFNNYDISIHKDQVPAGVTIIEKLMRPEYKPDELLPLSGIQHFCFCRRQWALIHLERQWQENVLTVEGKQLHNRADDPFFSEVRKGIIITRSMPVASYRLGFIGVCDVVEFTPAPQGVHLSGRQGAFLPAPVEYKRGKEKREPSDEAQLCAQAACLEEMLSVEIPSGYLFYGETRRRVEVAMTPELRGFVSKMAEEMHAYYDRGYTPQVKPSRACQSCSLKDICLPELQGKVISASSYIRMQIDGD